MTGHLDADARAVTDLTVVGITPFGTDARTGTCRATVGLAPDGRMPEPPYDVPLARTGPQMARPIAPRVGSETPCVQSDVGNEIHGAESTR